LRAYAFEFGCNHPLVGSEKVLFGNAFLELDFPLCELDFLGVVEVFDVLKKLKEINGDALGLEGGLALQVLLLGSELHVGEQSALHEEVHQHVAH
jgi:hypothetical protein